MYVFELERGKYCVVDVHYYVTMPAAAFKCQIMTLGKQPRLNG